MGGRCRTPGQCFVAGTLVRTESGLQPIEEVTVGTRVLARSDEDERGETLAWKPVVRTFRNRSRALMRLTLSDPNGAEEQLELTPSHRLFSPGRGWIAAAAVVPGEDQLVDPAGAPLAIREAVSLPEEVPVFNLEVEDHHTYFVGQLGAWVHNDVPRKIHVYWTGGDLPETALHNLQSWAAAAKKAGGGYTVTLWTTPNTISEAQQKALDELDIQIRTDARDLIPAKLQPYYDAALAAKGYAMASDLARYGFLPHEGGVYLDVDMAPGKIDLSKPPPQPKDADTAILIPTLRDEREWNSAVGAWRKNAWLGQYRTPTNEEVFHEMYKNPYSYNNGFIVSEKNPSSSFFAEMNDSVYQKLARYTSDGDGGLFKRAGNQIQANVKLDTDTAAFITGPTHIVTNGVLPFTERVQDANWINGIQWVTAASKANSKGCD